MSVLGAALLSLTHPIDEHLLHRLVVGHEHVPNGTPTHEMANFLSQIFGVVTGTLQRLRHEDNLEAGLMRNIFRVLDVAEEDQVAKAVDISVGTENIDGLADIAEKAQAQSASIFSSRVAIWVSSRMSSGSMRPRTDWALLAKLSR